MSASDSERNEAQGQPSAGGPKDPVVQNVERRILLEALRQVESINTDDDDWRIEPLPSGRIPGVFDELEDVLGSSVPDGAEGEADTNADYC